MAFWNRNKEVRSGPTTGLMTPTTWLADAFSSGTSPSGQRVSVNSALGVAPVWAAVSYIAEQVGQLPLKVYKQIDGDRVEARTHRAWDLLHYKPNDHTPADRFWSTVTTHLLLYGNAFVRKHRDSLGLVDELTLLNPSHMVVYWDGDQRIKLYNYTPVSGLTQVYGPEDVVHLYGLSLDGVVGLSVISQCKASFGAAMARDEFEGGFYNRGANLAGVLEHPNKLNEAAAKNLRDSFQALYGGSGKAHGVPVLEEGIKFTQIGSPLKDLEFVAAQQMSRTDIASMFKLPPNYLGGSSGDSLTYATVESNQIQFAQHAIAPWTNIIAKALTADSGIFPQNVYDAEFVLDGMLRADAGARGTYYQTMSGIKAITVNEIRRLENLPPIPGGDTIPKPAPPPQLAPSTDGPPPVDDLTQPPPKPAVAALNGRN